MLSKLFVFGIAAVVTGASSVGLVLSVVGHVGWAYWSSFAVGQSAGLIGAIFVSCGWNLTGARDIAQATGVGQAEMLWNGLLGRLALLLFVAAPVIVVARSLTPVGATGSEFIGMTFLLHGLNLQWFYTGLARPMLYLLCEAIPRAVAFTGAALSLAYLDFARFSVVLFLAVSFVVVLNWVVALTVVGGVHSGARFAEMRASLADGRAGLLNDLVSGVYLLAPTLVVAPMAPAGLAAFAFAERMQKFVKTAASPLLLSLQSWVFNCPADEYAGRILRSVHITAVVAVLSAAGYFAGTLLLASAVGGPESGLTGPLVLAFAIVTVCSVASMGVGLVGLVALGADPFPMIPPPMPTIRHYAKLPLPHPGSSL